jgi:hypothetical protein
LALLSKTGKGKGKGSSKKGNNDGGTSQPRKKKDLSKIKCFSCHKNGDYASQCLKKKMGRGNMWKKSSKETYLDDFAVKFKKYFSLVSCLYTSTTTRSAWYLDNGASRHMIEARELFRSMTENALGIHVDLGDDAEYAMKRDETILFQLESGGSFDA